MWSRLASGILAVVLISALIGCSDSSSSGGGGGHALRSITITPSSTSLPFGATQQYTATGNYSDGTSSVLPSVTWGSSAPDVATIDASGLVETLQHGVTTITATSGSISGSTGLTVTTELLSIGLTPIGPGVLVGGSEQFTAVGNFDDATTQDLTSTATWSSSDSTRASVTAGMATGVAVGVVTISVTSTAVSGSTIAASTALDVVDTPYPTLTGKYAFNLTSSDVDENGRGTLQLTTSSGTSNFAYYVVKSTRAAFVQTDFAPANAVAGVAELQTNQTYSVSSLSGGYSYLVTRPVVVGTGGASDRREFAQEGAWNFDSSTATLTGTRDDANNTDANGTNLNPLTDITGGCAVNPGGRGTLNAASAIQETNRKYIFYFVSPQKLFLLQTFNFAKGSNNAPTGVAEQQSGFPYSKATLNGVYALSAADITASYTGALVRLTFDGAGTTGGIGDLSVNGAISSTVVGASYSGFNPNPDASIGRGRIVLNEPIGAKNYIFYLISTDRAWILGSSPPATGSMAKQ